MLEEACLRCETLDPQQEGTFACFLWEVMGVAGEREGCRDTVIQSLAGCGDDDHAAKRFELASFYAETDREMREAMARHFRPGPRRGVSLAISLVRADGWSGLLQGCRLIGRAMEADRAAHWETSSLIWAAGERFGADAVERVLREANEPAVVRVLTAARVTPTIREPQRSFAELYRLAQEDPRGAGRRAKRWAGQAGEEELRVAAEALRTASEEEAIWMLGIFRRRLFPGDPRTLLELAERAGEIGESARKALVEVRHPAVREIGLRLRKARLLRNHRQPGDGELVRGWVEQGGHYEILEAFSLIGETEPEAWEAPMLHWIYEATECSVCRGTAVARMIRGGCLPDWMAEEARWDASADVREAWARGG